MMPESPTLAELLRVAIVLGALLLSGWALVDDVWDLVHVYRFGEIGGPRWVSAMEHFAFNGTLLVGWLAFLGVATIAVYLPSRTDAVENELSAVAGWLSLGFAGCVLIAQVHRRVGRQKLRAMPLESWERMLRSMFDGLSAAERVGLSARLLAATSAGREMGHAVANELQLPVALLDEMARDPSLTEARRSEASEAVARLEAVLSHVRTLHATIKDQQESGS